VYKLNVFDELEEQVSEYEKVLDYNLSESRCLLSKKSLLNDADDNIDFSLIVSYDSDD